jgi:hypothetical protein
MTLAIVVIILFIAFIFTIMALKKFSLKGFGVAISILCLIISGLICFTLPKMHKPFSIDIIEYLIKINDDGSMTTTKQVTKTIIKQNANEDIKK